jgi:Flp pilus assembly protein TadG
MLSFADVGTGTVRDRTPGRNATDPGRAGQPPRRARGAAAVEFAVIAPVILFVIIGIIEVARAFMVTEMLSSAARVGCRTGIIPGRSTSDVTTAVTNYLSGMGVTTESITVEVNDVVADPSTAADFAEITVIVSIPIANISWLPTVHYLTGTNLSAQYTLAKE